MWITLPGDRYRATSRLIDDRTYEMLCAAWMTPMPMTFYFWLGADAEQAEDRGACPPPSAN